MRRSKYTKAPDAISVPVSLSVLLSHYIELSPAPGYSSQASYYKQRQLYYATSRLSIPKESNMFLNLCTAPRMCLANNPWKP